VWRVAQQERERDTSAVESAGVDTSRALPNWARALADRIEVLSNRLEVPLNEDPKHADLLVLQVHLEQLQSDWEPFLADEASVLHDVDEEHWARSSKQREGAKQMIDTFLPDLNTFQRLLGAVDTHRKLTLADDLAQAEINIVFLQKKRDEFAQNRKAMVKAVVPLLNALAQLT
jgi:hypothetical protein